MDSIQTKENTLVLGTNDFPLESSTITFNASATEPILELKGNGDIFVKGKLIENDKEVVGALREFLQTQGFINT
jgi:hypothetical protein